MEYVLSIYLVQSGNSRLTRAKWIKIESVVNIFQNLTKNNLLTP